MLLQGVHPKIVSERRGHASIGITLDTYSHVLPGCKVRPRACSTNSSSRVQDCPLHRDLQKDMATALVGLHRCSAVRFLPVALLDLHRRASPVAIGARRSLGGGTSPARPLLSMIAQGGSGNVLYASARALASRRRNVMTQTQLATWRRLPAESRWRPTASI
jgi:hypothetical protein